MATTVDTLITELKLRSSQFKQGIADIRRLITGVYKFFSTLTAKAVMLVGVMQQIIFTVGVLSAAMGGLIKVFYGTFVEIESFKIAIKGTLSETENIIDVFEGLLEISNRTGAGIDSLSRHFTGLNTVIREARSTATLLEVLGTAMAKVGGSDEEIDRLLTNFRQIMSMGRLTGDEFREIAALMPQFTEALYNAFGTVSTEELSARGIGAKEVVIGVVKELQKLGGLADNPRLGISKLTNAFTQFKYRVGELMHTYLGPFIQMLTRFLQILSSAEFFGKIKDGFESMFKFDKKSVIRFFATLLAYIQTLPRTIRYLRVEIRNWLNNFQDGVRKLARLFSFYLGYRLATALIPIISAAIAFMSALKAAFGTSVALKAFWTRNWKEIAAAIMAVLAGVAAVIGLDKVLDNFMGGPDLSGITNPKGLDNLIGQNMAALTNFDRGALSDEFKEFNLDNMLGGDQNKSILEGIEENTFNTAKYMRDSIGSTILGGGDRAAKGISAHEKHIAGKGVKGQLVSAIESYVEEQVENVIYRMSRRRRWAGL